MKQTHDFFPSAFRAKDDEAHVFTMFVETADIDVGTACSGSDSPVISLRSLPEALQDLGVNARPINHKFSCDWSEAERATPFPGKPAAGQKHRQGHCWRAQKGQKWTQTASLWLATG